ncbi:hypothetical protein AB0O76_30560 [Streptomyces sp. NPDC086554]|uniref:hypothetical protein n=1 Tax=Streptomyces sp. NPDC086554 TaxID=3154864 RepID=UPI00341863EE
MTLEWEQVIVHSSDDEFEIRPEPNRLPGLEFVQNNPRLITLADTDPEGNEFCVLGQRRQ